MVLSSTAVSWFPRSHDAMPTARPPLLDDEPIANSRTTRRKSGADNGENNCKKTTGEISSGYNRPGTMRHNNVWCREKTSASSEKKRSGATFSPFRAAHKGRVNTMRHTALALGSIFLSLPIAVQVAASTTSPPGTATTSATACKVSEFSIPPATNQIQPGVLQYKYLRFFESDARQPPLEEVFFVLEAAKYNATVVDLCPAAFAITHVFAAAVYLFRGTTAASGDGSAQDAELRLATGEDPYQNENKFNSNTDRHLLAAKQLETKYGKQLLRKGWPLDEAYEMFWKEKEKLFGPQKILFSAKSTEYSATHEKVLQHAELLGGGATPSGAKTTVVAPASTSTAAGTKKQTMHILICHCRENLDWVIGPDFVIPGPEKRTNEVEITLLIYDKCQTPIGEEKTELYMSSKLFHEVKSVPCDDPVGFRRDECVAYLQYLVEYYDKFPDYLMLLQSDVEEHAYWGYINLVMESIVMGTAKNIPFIPLNNGRIVQNLTPCKKKIFEETFGRVPKALGTYCCAQFVVSRQRLQLPPITRYHKLLTMLDDQEAPKPECNDIKGHSTHCLMYETIWHVLWGEPDLLPLRGENVELPLFLRARDVDNESYLPIGSQYMTTIMSLTTEDPNAPPAGEAVSDGQEGAMEKGKVNSAEM
ncbi:unnamed protein product [Amoebophrya sp. A120]|nr:unnamed protein product [Amoebophrya sp. A120]|eukprot:GSA120T00013251001.1